MEVAFPSHDDRFTMKLSEDFTKLEFPKEEIRNLERSWSQLEDSVQESDNDEEQEQEHEQEHEQEQEQEEEHEQEQEQEEEFSFAYVNTEGSPITADEAFKDGQIRPAFPLFNRDLLFHYNHTEKDAVSITNENIRPRLRKLFVDDQPRDESSTEVDPLGPYCAWSSGTVEETSPETCKKSNSTGFSKLWRFRDLVLRSNSDGRDAFVFLNDNKTQSSSSKVTSEDEKKVSAKTKKGKDKTVSEKKTKSAHEKLYMRNRAIKEEGKHRSYLPYKQVGFFTNVNGLSRNIHPF